MKSFFLTINGLQMRRYDVTATYNVIPGHIPTFSTAGLLWTTQLTPPTYDLLIERLRAYLAIDSEEPAKSAIQRFRNHTSTLHAYLAFTGKTTASRVGAELGALFDDTVRDYLATSAVSSRSKRDRRAHLALFKKLNNADAPQVTQQKQTPLAQELRTAVSRAGIAPKTLAKEAGISPSAIQRWLKGAMPNRRGLAPLRRLESRLGLPREQLTKLVTDPIETPSIAPRPIRHREMLLTRKSASLMLAESRLGPEFLQEWQALFAYKTRALTALNRHPKGVWRLIPRHVSNRVSRLAMHGDSACPTADFTLGQIRVFFGAIAANAAALGISDVVSTKWQTLAWLAHREALAVVLNYLTDHAGGLKHNAQKTFCAMASALVRPVTGYLWQQPQFGKFLPESERPENEAQWRTMCEGCHTLLRDFKSTAKDLSRNPQEPIEDLLALNDPNRFWMQSRGLMPKPPKRLRAVSVKRGTTETLYC
jgi:transcriptional regulator with XRE-family HTH domain